MSGVVKTATNVYNQVSGTAGMAEAAQNAAMDQMSEAQRARRMVMDEGKRAEARLDKELDSPQQIMAMDKFLAQAQRQVDSEQRLIESLDPALLEASTQALKLLRGETSGTLDPLKQQRARQRQTLLNNLRAQMGPGAETSSAGIKALNAFDAETDNLFSNAQQGAIMNLSNIFSQGVGSRAGLNQGMAGLNSFNTLGLNRAQARTSLTPSLLSAMSGANQNVIGAAGGQYVGDMTLARGQNQLFNMGVQAGSAAVGMPMSVPSGASGSPGVGTQAGSFKPIASP